METVMDAGAEFIRGAVITIVAMVIGYCMGKN